MPFLNALKTSFPLVASTFLEMVFQHAHPLSLRLLRMYMCHLSSGISYPLSKTLIRCSHSSKCTSLSLTFQSNWGNGMCGKLALGFGLSSAAGSAGVPPSAMPVKRIERAVTGLTSRELALV